MRLHLWLCISLKYWRHCIIMYSYGRLLPKICRIRQTICPHLEFIHSKASSRNSNDTLLSNLLGGYRLDLKRRIHEFFNANCWVWWSEISDVVIIIRLVAEIGSNELTVVFVVVAGVIRGVILAPACVCAWEWERIGYLFIDPTWSRICKMAD